MKEMRALEVSLSQWTAKCTAMRDRQAGETARRQLLVAELKLQISNMLDARRAIESAEEAQERLAGEQSRAEERLRLADLRREEAERLLEAKNQNLMERRVKEADLRARLQKAEEDRKRYERSLSEGKEQIEYCSLQIRDCEAAVRQLENSNTENEISIAGISDERQAEAETQRNYEEMKREIDAELGGMLGRITETSEQIARCTERLNQAEIKKVREESEINANKNRLWEEYELAYSSAKELTGGKRTENYTEASRRIKELKASIKALGAVNVNAVEEYESTKERHTFLSAQMGDLSEAKAKLQKVISDLNAVMRRQFSEQFRLIRDNFKEVFRQLFGGGKADIVLDETQDILECGIEIQAQPPGKKLQNMLLLSGGERALTAIALLFGILKMHPSPFCLLDEIEAALDDANVYRLSDYLRQIDGGTQFILITHRKGTMENAGSLYGVTMEEKGISKVISLKMDS